MSTSLETITGHEAGAVMYSDGQILIGNWSGIEGLPRVMNFGSGELIGLGGKLEAKPTLVPKEMKLAMQKYETSRGLHESKDGFCAWNINNGDAVVVVQKGWA